MEDKIVIYDNNQSKINIEGKILHFYWTLL